MRPGGGFQPNFPLMAKVEVNGANEEKLFTWLKVSCELCDNENGKNGGPLFRIITKYLFD